MAVDWREGRAVEPRRLRDLGAADDLARVHVDVEDVVVVEREAERQVRDRRVDDDVTVPVGADRVDGELLVVEAERGGRDDVDVPGLVLVVGGPAVDPQLLAVRRVVEQVRRGAGGHRRHVEARGDAKELDPRPRLRVRRHHEFVAVRLDVAEAAVLRRPTAPATLEAAAVALRRRLRQLADLGVRQRLDLRAVGAEHFHAVGSEDPYRVRDVGVLVIPVVRLCVIVTCEQTSARARSGAAARAVVASGGAPATAAMSAIIVVTRSISMWIGGLGGMLWA